MEAWYESKLRAPWMRKYFSFQGRLNRKPYILRGIVLYVIYQLVCLLIGVLVALALGASVAQRNDLYIHTVSFVVGLVPNMIYSLGSFSLIARRLHDLDKKAGWFIKINLIAVVLLYGALLVCWLLYFFPATFMVAFGMILLVGSVLTLFSLYVLVIMICLLFQKGTEGVNRFGKPLV